MDQHAFKGLSDKPWEKHEAFMIGTNQRWSVIQAFARVANAIVACRWIIPVSWLWNKHQQKIREQYGWVYPMRTGCEQIWRMRMAHGCDATECRAGLSSTNAPTIVSRKAAMRLNSRPDCWLADPRRPASRGNTLKKICSDKFVVVICLSAFAKSGKNNLFWSPLNRKTLGEFESVHMIDDVIVAQILGWSAFQTKVVHQLFRKLLPCCINTRGEHRNKWTYIKLT